MNTRVLKKETKKTCTIWTFAPYGSYKDTKSGRTYYQEMKLGTPLTDKFIESLLEKNYEEYERGAE